MADPAYCKISALSGEGAEIRNQQTGRAVIRDEKPEIPWTLFTGEASAESWLDDSPGEEQLRQTVNSHTGIAEEV